MPFPHQSFVIADDLARPPDARFLAFDFEALGGKMRVHAQSVLQQSDVFVARPEERLHSLGDGDLRSGQWRRFSL